MLILLIIGLLIILFIYSKRKEGFKTSFMDGIDIIYWINLDRSPERRESMEKMFEDEVFSEIPNISRRLNF